MLLAEPVLKAELPTVHKDPVRGMLDTFVSTLGQQANPVQTQPHS